MQVKVIEGFDDREVVGESFYQQNLYVGGRSGGRARSRPRDYRRGTRESLLGQCHLRSGYIGSKSGTLAETTQPSSCRPACLTGKAQPTDLVGTHHHKLDLDHLRP